MKTIASIATLLAVALAAPSAPLSSRQTTAGLPALTTVSYRVRNLEDPKNFKSAQTTLKVNGGAQNFDENSDLVSAGNGRLNTDGHVYATRVEIVTPLQGVHCNLYNDKKHVIYEFSDRALIGDFDGVEASANVTDKAVNADKYSLLCYYV